MKIKSRLEKLKAQSPTNNEQIKMEQQPNIKPEIDALHAEMHADQLKQKKQQ